MKIEYQHEDDTGEAFRLSKDQIEGETNIATLLKWSDELASKSDDITAQIEAHVLTEIEADDWLIPARDALTYAKMGHSRIQRRLRKLGVTSEDQDRIASLREHVAKLKTDLAKSRVSIAIASAAREILSDEVYGAVAKRADQLLGVPDALAA